MAQVMTGVEQPRRPGRAWWLGLLALLVLAGVLRFIGSQFSLPYVDHPDEPIFYLTALEWRGVFSINNVVGGYPPLYIWLYGLAQVLLGPFGIDSLAEGIGLFRLLSVVFSLTTLVLIALTAWRIMGEWAGWTAGIAWAVAPLVVENAIYAAPDPLLYLIVAFALWLAVESLYGRPTWALWSVAAGCLAILDKYYVLTAVLPGMGAILVMIWSDRRRGLRLLALASGFIVITGVISLMGILVLPREAATARDSGLANVLNPERVLNNIYYAFFPLGPIAFVSYAVAGVGAWLAAPRFGSPRARPIAVLLILLTVITIPWLAATFSMVGPTAVQYHDLRMKDVLPATVGMCILLGVAVGQITALVPARWQWVGGAVAVLPLASLVWLPQAADSVAIIQNRLLPDQRVALRQWADSAIEPGTVLVDLAHEKTFNPYWGGIPGQRWFDWWKTDDLLGETVAGWRQDHGISYAVIEQSQWERLPETEAGRAFANAVLPLRSFTGPGRGPDTIFVRLWRPETETEARFGDAIRLVGYDLSAETAAPGDPVMLRFYWNAAAPPAANYSMFVHLVPAGGDGQPVAQADGAPASPGRPTLLWTDASETLISDMFTLALPVELAPGAYELRIGLYDYATGARLPVAAAGAVPSGDALRLTTLTVSSPA